MDNQIYLVTGAAGFLGINICHSLVKKNERVRALVLNGDKAAAHLPKEVEIFYGDLLDKESLLKFFTVPENTKVIVIHSASIVALSPEKNQKVYDVNVTGTQNIIDLCSEKKVQKLVYISSTGAITELPKKKVIAEPKSFSPEKLVGYYSVTKAMATQLVFDAVKNGKVNASVVYPSGICGPYDYANGPFVQFVIQYCNEEVPAGIQGSFNSVDVRDLAEGVVTCAEKGENGEGYIMGNEVVSMKQLFELMSKLSGAKPVKKVIGTTTARIIAFVSETISKLTKKPPMMSSFQVYNLARNNNFDSSKAREKLGYQTRPVEQTMKDTIDWLKSENKIKDNTQK